jgi:hypothetical protein
MRDSALAGAGLILVVTLGAANYGGVSAASSEPPASGHACSIAAAAVRPLTGIRVCGSASPAWDDGAGGTGRWKGLTG